ncbi:MAG: hypothetical protein RL274_2821 [Pseudomonadota bacterium]
MGHKKSRVVIRARQSLAAALHERISFHKGEELTLWLRTRLCPCRQESAMSQETRTLVEASQTLGAAFLAGLRPHVRCLPGKRMGPVKVEPCGYATKLHLESLIWTHGPKYPCWRLASRLRCPRCGGTVVEMTRLPGGLLPARARRDLYQCVVASGRG